MSNIYKIPESNEQNFKIKFDKLVRRANKLGITPPSFTCSSPELDSVKVNGKDVIVVYRNYEISHPIVKVGNWIFIASLEHTDEGNVTHNISEKDIPNHYWDCDANCEHCNLKRNRKDTFIVQRAVGPLDYKQVGSSCLNDFLGVDASHAASMAEIYSATREMANASEHHQGDNWTAYDYLDQYLSHVVEVIGVSGWVTVNRSKETGLPSTKEVAYNYMHNCDDRDPPSEMSLSLAQESIAWCEELTDSQVESSEYLHNIRVIARRGVVGQRQYGFAASIFMAYQNALETEMKGTRGNPQSNYVGTTRERCKFTVKVDNIKQVENQWGIMQLHTMHDTDGNKMVWFSSGKLLKAGEWQLINATVKSHSEYRGVKQTVLSRCEFISLINTNVS